MTSENSDLMICREIENTMYTFHSMKLHKKAHALKTDIQKYTEKTFSSPTLCNG